MPDTMYVLSMNAEQAELLHQAADFYARIGTGQLEELLSHPAVMTQQNLPGHSPETARALVTQLKDELFNLPANAGQSIHSEQVPGAMRILWDIRNVIRHRLAWDKADNPPTRDFGTMLTVDFDEPVKTGTAPLPVMENATALEQEMTALKDESIGLQRRLAVVMQKLGKE